MSVIKYVLLGVIGLIVLIFLAGVLIILFMPIESAADFPEPDCDRKAPVDSTVIDTINGIEDFAAFSDRFYMDDTFQMSRVKFPIVGIKTPAAWHSHHWTPCNWTSLKKYYSDTTTYSIIPIRFLGDSLTERTFRVENKVTERAEIHYLEFQLMDKRWFLDRREWGKYQGK